MSAEGGAERPLRLLVVDDHEVVRRGVAEVLEDDPIIVVVGEAGSAAVGDGEGSGLGVADGAHVRPCCPEPARPDTGAQHCPPGVHPVCDYCTQDARFRSQLTTPPQPRPWGRRRARRRLGHGP